MAAAEPAAGRLRAIVFDFDGVVLESADLKTDAFVELFDDLGPERVAQIRAHHLAHLGVSRFVKFAWIHETLLGRAITPAESAALGDRFSALVLAKVLACPFVPGAREALEALAPRYPLFVASGTPHDELVDVVARRGLAPRFREVHGSPTTKDAILRDVIARHGLAPAEVLMIGDGTTDHDAARAVGTGFLARDTPPLHAVWRERGVRRVDDLRDLPALVAAW
jgi:phosphoglycolate phosphatase-like HAD superfamily hydrolase